MGKYVLSDLFEGNYPVSQYYGENKPYYAQFGFFLGHEGVDWATPVGTNILIPFASGTILQAAWHPQYGYYVVTWDPKQLCAVWDTHLSTISCQAGQKLNRGTVIGRSGATGNVTGAHLHAGFVETDENANRKNMDNGNKGFLNILDPNLVYWTSSNPPAIPPSPDSQIKQIKLIINTSISDTEFRNKTRSILQV